jgi:two-component system, cell cycle response regulator
VRVDLQTNTVSTAWAPSASFSANVQMTPRQRFDHRLSSEVAFVRLHGEHVALLLLAIDRVDAVADRWGAGAGEIIVTSLARRVAAALPVEERVDRFEAHKLAVVRRIPTAYQAITLAERLRTRVSDTPVAMPQARDALFVTVSVGVAVFPSPGLAGAPDIVAAAEWALHRAVAAGGNRVCSAGVEN